MIENRQNREPEPQQNARPFGPSVVAKRQQFDHLETWLCTVNNLGFCGTI